MSLLNEMLKDLSENKGRPKASPYLIQNPQKPFMELVPRVVRWLVVTLGLSLFILMVGHKINTMRSKPLLNPAGASVAVRVPTIQTNLQRSPKVVSTQTHSVVEPVKTIAAEAVQSLPSLLVPIQFARIEKIPPPLEEVVFENSEFLPTTEQEGIRKLLPQPNTKEWHDLQLNQALEAIQNGDEQRAITLLEIILTKFPNSIDARESLAAIYLSRTAVGDAMRVLEEGLAFEPSSLALNKMKARLLFEQDRSQEALQLLEQFKPDIRAETDYYGLVAAVLQTLGRVEEAGSLYKSLVEIDPSNGQYWLGYGIALEEKHAYQQAIIAYQRVSQTYEVDPAIRAYAEGRLKQLKG